MNASIKVVDGESLLSRKQIVDIFAANEEFVDPRRICYYPTLQALVERAGGSKAWSAGEVFAFVESPERFVVMEQVAPASCEMVTITNAGFQDVLTAYRYSVPELVNLLDGYMNPREIQNERAAALGFNNPQEMLSHQKWIDARKQSHSAAQAYQQSPDASQSRLAAGVPADTWVEPVGASDDPVRFRLDVSLNPLGWSIVELSVDGGPFSGRLTKEMVNFDTDREDIQVNEHGVVHFYDHSLARHLLSVPGHVNMNLLESNSEATRSEPMDSRPRG